jgi:hypothetical protein
LCESATTSADSSEFSTIPEGLLKRADVPTPLVVPAVELPAIVLTAPVDMVTFTIMLEFWLVT